MAGQCVELIRGKALRLTRLDICGNPVTGAKGTLVSKGMVKIEMNPQRGDATTVLVRNANDELIISDRGKPPLQWYETTITFGSVDLDAPNMITGAPTVVDDTGAVIGWDDAEGYFGDFAVEVWTDVAKGACVAGLKPYGYFLLPWVTAGISGEMTVQNQEVSFIASGVTHNTSPWGTGPYNVRFNGSGVPSKLISPILTVSHRRTFVTYLAPPVPSCGAVTL